MSNDAREMEEHQANMPELRAKSQDTPRAPEIDVIILSLDRVNDTIAAIDSTLAQCGVRQKIWIVDQGSQPDAIESLQRHVAGKPAVHLEIVGRNLGVPGGRNLASRLGCAPYIVALDNDAVFRDDDELAKAVRRLQTDASLAAIGFRVLNLHTGEDDEMSWGYPKSLRPHSSREFFAAFFIGTGHAVRRDLFEAVGGYDDSLFFCWEELDVCYRLINRGYRILYAPEVVIFHKVSPQRRVNWAGGRFYYLVRNRLYLDYKFGAPIPRTIALAIAYILKGTYNGVSNQAWRGAWDAIGMCRRYRRTHGGRTGSRLSADARRYVFDHDQRHRGSFWRRIRLELFARLPGRR